LKSLASSTQLLEYWTVLCCWLCGVLWCGVLYVCVIPCACHTLRAACSCAIARSALSLGKNSSFVGNTNPTLQRNMQHATRSRTRITQHTSQHHHNTTPTHNHYQLIYCREQERNGEEWRGMERNGEEWRGMEWNGVEWKRVGMFPPSFISPLFSFPSPSILFKINQTKRGEVYLDSPPFSKFFSIFL
jgi:hypothetical protein